MRPHTHSNVRRLTRERSSPRRRSRARAALAFTAPIVLLTYYALRGGSYDLTARQEAGLVAWWVIGLGFALGLLPRVRPARLVAVPLAAAVLLALWTAAGLSWTQSHERTLAEVARTLHHAGLLVLVWSLAGRSTWRPAAAGVATGAALICVIAVASRLAPEAFPADAVRQAFGTDRLNYPFEYWNALAAWGVMSTAMVLAWSSHARTLYVRAAALAVAPVCALAVYLTYSRQGVLGMAIALAAVLALSRNRWVTAVHALGAGAGSAAAVAAVRDAPQIADASGTAGAATVALTLLGAAGLAVAAAAVTWWAGGDRKWRMSPPLGRIAAAGGASIALLLLGTVGQTPLARAWDEFSEEQSAAVSSPADPAVRLTSFGGNRNRIWDSALDAFAAEPLHGVGPGTYEFWWNREGDGEFIRDAHSLYLEQLAELGVPGLALTLLLLGGVGFAALASRRRLSRPADLGAHAAVTSGFVAFLVHAGVDWMWESTAVTVLGLSAGALGGAAATAGRRPPGVRVRVAVALFAGAACLVQLPGLVSTTRLAESRESFRAGDMVAARKQANDAVRAQPWAASPYVQRALVAESSGNLKGAARDQRRAADREPTNWRHQLVLARVEAERGRLAAALSAYRRARRLRPRSAFFRPPPRQ